MEKSDKWCSEIGVGAVKISDLSKQYIAEVLSQNRLSYGKFSRQFETNFAHIHGCKYAIFVNSGTSALQIAVAALKEKYGWKEGEEVIVPALTFVASSNVILQNNLNPIFVDVDPKYYNLDPAKIEAAITPKTRAIMVVHLFGQPAEMDRIMEVAQKHNLRVIEDSCETMLAKYADKTVGSWGDISCFSTYACHIICTGVGGLALTNNPELAVMLRSLANHGRDAIYTSMDDDKTEDREELRMIMNRRFNFIRNGYSFRATEMEAALGLAQLETLEYNISIRRLIASLFNHKLSRWDKQLQLPAIHPQAEHSFMMFPVVIKDPKIVREELTLFLEENNIETRPLPPLVNQPFYKSKYGVNIEDKFPVAKHLNNNGFYIGCHPEISTKEVEYIVKKIDQFMEKKNLNGGITD
ncbi:MAG TPA: DegT/DnrJ/EryC1/StrS family aminotransferase [Candidatus Nanoarchaeia archaeon]|nr:DegT/DnrJ/EryC1/StrS family aminotransferase [Candidatus Nanoarchaeia archaeon]